MSKQSSLQRTLQILNRLNTGKKLSLTELSYEYDVSERTIRRDIEILREEYKDFIKKDGNFYYAVKQDLLSNVLSGKDLSILLNIIHLFSSTGNKIELPEELKKIYKDNTNVYNFVNKPFEEIKNKETMYKIEKAIIDKRVCEIDYLNEVKKTTTKIELKPYKILLLNENFYVFGETNNKHKYAMYRIGLVKEFKLLPSNFYPKPELLRFTNNIQTPFAKFTKNEDMKEVIVSVPKQTARYFKMKKYLPSQKILSESKSGWLKISYTVTNYREVTELIEKWMPNMKINFPEELKEIVKKDLTSKLKSLNI